MRAQTAASSDSFAKDPTVFLISENDEAYGRLVSSTPVLLMEVCNNSMEEAFQKWVYFLADIEEYAFEKNFEIRGLKIWINVFWNKDGTIKHIVYHPKPNSKNIDYTEFTSFLDDFTSFHRLNTEFNNDFAHYGSASFPTFVEQIFPERGK